MAAISKYSQSLVGAVLRAVKLLCGISGYVDGLGDRNLCITRFPRKRMTICHRFLDNSVVNESNQPRNPVVTGGRMCVDKMFIKAACLVLAAKLLLQVAAFAGAGVTTQLWQVAKPRPFVSGAPKYSDVSMRSLRPHPVKPGDPHDTLDMAQQFHLTRLEWTYEMDQAFVKKAKALGLVIGGALEDESSDAQGLKTIGRVTGEGGELKKHRWFPVGRWVGCANAPEFMEATLLWARRDIDAGVDVMQQDDPQMAVRCVPPFCYCNYCKEGFVRYQNEHGKDSSYEQFQKDSILAFHKEMHKRLDAYAGRHVPFSHNSGVGRYGELGWVSSAFDFVLAEIYGETVHPELLYKNLKAANGVPLSFQYRETSVSNNRRGLATFYAIGATMLMPWDVYLNNSERYFGLAADYADLSGFIRANTIYLDGYEDAAAVGPGIQETRYGPVSPIVIESGSSELFAFARARPGHSNAPVVIHLVEWNIQGKPFTLRLRTVNFFGSQAIKVGLRVPAPYDVKLHKAAQTKRDFTNLAVETPLQTTREGDYTVVQIPALRPWGMLIIQP